MATPWFASLLTCWVIISKVTLFFCHLQNRKGWGISASHCYGKVTVPYVLWGEVVWELAHNTLVHAHIYICSAAPHVALFAVLGDLVSRPDILTCLHL